MPFQSIALPTDLAHHSIVVFAHAVKLALYTGAKLTVIHTTDSPAPVDWSRLPTVRALLTDWGALAPDATVDDFAKLGLHVRVEVRRGPDPQEAAAGGIEHVHADLIVLGSHRRSGFERWVRGSVAEGIARQAGIPTFFVGERMRPVVDPRTGEEELKRVLVPFEPGMDLQVLGERAASIARGFGSADIEVRFLDLASEKAEVPKGLSPKGWTYRASRSWGPTPVERILHAALEERADLVVMATRGHENLIETLAGSKTEQVLRDVSVPLVSWPLKA